MSPAEFARLHRAARTLNRADQIRARLASRVERASAILAPTLAGSDHATVPGFRVHRVADGLAVEPIASEPVDQLALW